MQKFDNILVKMLVFNDISSAEIVNILKCFKGHFKNYTSGDIILHLNSHLDQLYIIVKGNVALYQQIYENEPHLLTVLNNGDVLGELFLCSDLVDINDTYAQAQNNCTVLSLDYKHILQTCANACSCHSKFIKNLLQLVSKQAIMLNRKIIILSAHGIKDRIILYLKELSVSQNSKIVALPFSKKSLAEYLCVNRSALMRELSKMAKDSIIEINGNIITCNYI